MKRKLYSSLLEWKINPDRKPLVLEGARQVGKTYLLKEFGRNEFSNLLYVNCHDNPTAHKIFEQDLDTKRIIMALEAYTGRTITKGHTLVIIDEIQEAPHALESLKYFCENERDLHVVVAGSLLGIVNHPGESYPVGKVSHLRLYPMTFEEFLWAIGEDMLAEHISHCQWDILNALHLKIEGLLRQYYFVGGMPEAVASFVKHGDVKRVRAIQQDILQTYSSDFSKHAGNDTQRVRLVWNSIPAQLARENKKFVYGAVKPGGRARDLENAIQWLVDAGVALRVFRCSKPSMPLKFYEDFNAFKLYLLDVGLLGALTNVPSSLMLIGNNVFTEYKGAFTENYTLQQLTATADMPIYYYSKLNSTQEVDFLVQCGQRIIPIEVKAEVNVKSKSLRGFITIDHKENPLKGLRCSMLPYKDQGWMENIPLYSICGYFANQGLATE